jgi:cyclophilin family peptidyl-prolyl cis-trans isomerase
MRPVAALLLLLSLPLWVAACGDGDGSPGGNTKSFSQAQQSIDPAKEYTALFVTSKGEFAVRLYAGEAPMTVNSFVFLAKQGYFDGLTFHRVVKGFVIQSGDPTGSGSGGPGYETADEPNQLSNRRGTLAMAKMAGAKVFGSQFFINLSDNTGLDWNNPSNNKFYPFGEVISGIDVVDAIAASPVRGSQPDPEVVITSVRISER